MTISAFLRHATAGAAAALLLGGVCVAAQRAPREAPPREVLVSAASSLTDVLRTLAAVYESRSGVRVVLNLAASNALVQQVRAGAPVDVFVSADERQIAALGPLARPASRVELASNQLAIVVPDDRPAGWASARGLLDSGVRRVAIGEPSTVPAGVYARIYLERTGLWALLAPKLVPSGSVRLALAAVEAGAADAAIVYRTDAAAAKRSRVAWLVPASEEPRIRYVAVALTRAPLAAEADALLRFLGSADARSIFARAGFGPPLATGTSPGGLRRDE